MRHFGKIEWIDYKAGHTVVCVHMFPFVEFFIILDYQGDVRFADPGEAFMAVRSLAESKVTIGGVTPTAQVLRGKYEKKYHRKRLAALSAAAAKKQEKSEAHAHEEALDHTSATEPEHAV